MRNLQHVSGFCDSKRSTWNLILYEIIYNPRRTAQNRTPAKCIQTQMRPPKLASMADRNRIIARLHQKPTCSDITLLRLPNKSVAPHADLQNSPATLDSIYVDTGPLTPNHTIVRI